MLGAVDAMEDYLGLLVSGWMICKKRKSPRNASFPRSAWERMRSDAPRPRVVVLFTIGC
jgi:hypothetical protein